jgi:hypothetical protein
LRHFLGGKFGPVSASLHPTRVETSAARRALKPGTSAPHLLGTTLPSALRAAVPLTPITATAKRHLNVATRTQAIENPIPLVDHPPPLASFWTSAARRAISTPSRDHAAPLKARSAIRAFAFSGGQRLVTAPRSSGPERRRILALSRAQRRNYADPESRRHVAIGSTRAVPWSRLSGR